MDPFNTQGAFSWNELTTSDPAGAAAFYRELFGWRIDEMNMGTGPYRVVTSKALFGFDGETKRITLLAVLRGLDPDDVVKDMGFRPLMSKDIEEIPPPTPEELRLLREEIDPSRFLIRGEWMSASA